MKIRKVNPMLFTMMVLLLGASTVNVKATVVNFDDLIGPMTLTGSNYAGLTWELGNIGHGGIYPGEWIIDYIGSSYWPYSPPNNVVNGFGATLMGIGFPTKVDVLGAYFAGQGAEVGWTTGIRVHGYREGMMVATTPWFNDIDAHPDWFAINLSSVDRIVIESIPVFEGAGYYNMDDLTYIPEPTTVLLLALGGVTLLRKRRG